MLTGLKVPGAGVAAVQTLLQALSGNARTGGSVLSLEKG
jgi:hypothetical protein